MEACAIAHDGNEGLQRFNDFHPDRVVLDLTLPGRNGLEVLQQIIKSGRKTAVFVVTGIDEEEGINEARKAGAFKVYRKPLRNVEEFIGEVIETSADRE